MYVGKGKAMPVQALPGPEAPKYHDNRYKNVVRLSNLRTDGLYSIYSIGNMSGTHFC
jgi:hypothetical protein